MKSRPNTRLQFERNMNLAADRIRNGQQQFTTRTSGIAKSLLKVKKLPNGRLNFLSVDESARLHANHIAEMMDHYMDKLMAEKFKKEK